MTVFIDKLSDLPATPVPASETWLQARAYAADGDGGGARYRRVASEPGHPGKARDAGGGWWEIDPQGGMAAVECFGAKGSGLASDAAVNRAALHDAHLAWKAGAFAELRYRSGGEYHLGGFDGPAPTELLGAAHLEGASGRIYGAGATLVFTSDKQAAHHVYRFGRNEGVAVIGLAFHDTSGIDPSLADPKGVTCLGIHSDGYAEDAGDYLFESCSFRGVLATIAVRNDDPLGGAGRIRGIRIRGCTAHDCHYGPTFEEDGDDAEIDFSAFNVRRIYAPGGVSGHKARLDCSHDGVFPGSDAMIEVARRVGDAADIEIDARFHGAVAAFVPLVLAHRNGLHPGNPDWDAGDAALNGSQSTIQGIRARLTFDPGLVPGTASPAVRLISQGRIGGTPAQGYADGALAAMTTPLALGGDSTSPVTSLHRTLGIDIEIRAGGWGTQPFVEADHYPQWPGDVKLATPPSRNRTETRLEGFEVDGWFTIEKSGSLHNKLWSIPMRHVYDWGVGKARVAVEFELMAVEAVDNSGKTHFKRYYAHAHANSLGGTTGLKDVTEIEDMCLGSSDLAFAGATGSGLGGGFIDRLRYQTTTATDFTGANSFARLRARLRPVKE